MHILFFPPSFVRPVASVGYLAPSQTFLTPAALQREQQRRASQPGLCTAHSAILPFMATAPHISIDAEICPLILVRG